MIDRNQFFDTSQAFAETFVKKTSEELKKCISMKYSY